MLPNVRPATGQAEQSEDAEDVPPPPPPPPPPRPMSADESEDDMPEAPPTPPGEQEDALEHELEPGSPSHGVLLMPPPDTPPSRLCSPDSVGLGRLSTPDVDPRRAGLATPDIDPRFAQLTGVDGSGLEGLVEDSEEDEEGEEFPPADQADGATDATGKVGLSRKRKADRSAMDDQLQGQMLDAVLKGRRGRGGKPTHIDSKASADGAQQGSKPSEAVPDVVSEDDEPDGYSDAFEADEDVSKPAEDADVGPTAAEDADAGLAAAAAGSPKTGAPSVDVDGTGAVAEDASQAASQDADRLKEPGKGPLGGAADELQDSMISAAAQARREAARQQREASMSRPSSGGAPPTSDLSPSPTAAAGDLRDAASSSPAAEPPPTGPPAETPSPKHVERKTIDETPVRHIEAEMPLVVEDISDKDKESRGGSKDVPSSALPSSAVPSRGESKDASGADGAQAAAAQAAAARHEADLRPEEPPEEKILEPEEMYEQEVARARTALQMSALRWLREQDINFEAKFTAHQAVELVRELANAKIRQAEKVQRTRRETKPWKGFTCDCCIWVVFAIILAWTAMLVAASLSRPILSEGEGVLTTANGQPAAAAVITNFHSFSAVQTAAEDTLRRIRYCTFVHRDASHHIHAASLVRSASGDVTISAPDGSRLRLQGRLGTAGGRITFTRPFFGEDNVDLGDQSQGCGFTAMAAAPLGHKMQAV